MNTMSSNKHTAAGRCLSACLIVTILCVSPAVGQRYLEEAIPYRQEATIRTATGFIEARFMRKEYIGTARPSDHYYSYYRDSVYTTQGGYHGYPLHGRYVERYPDKGLKVLGQYRYGLRVGKWQYWDEGGVLRKVSHWRAGQETGRFRIYDEAGELQQRGYLPSEMESGLLRAVNWMKNIFW